MVSGFMIRKRVSDQVPCKADFAGIYMYWRVQNDLSACMRFVILNEMGVMVMELCIGFEKRNRMTCGTCLNYYGLTEKLAVGSVTNMYAIVEKLTHAGNVVKP